MNEWHLDKIKKKELAEQIRILDDKELRLSNGWLCFHQDNKPLFPESLSGTNHAFLKFDLHGSEKHNWRGVKLETTKQDGNPVVDNHGKTWTTSTTRLVLTEYEGPPRDMKYVIKLDTKFDNFAGGTTVGALIEIISREGLRKFAFDSRTIGDCFYVGCRDFV